MANNELSLLQAHTNILAYHLAQDTSTRLDPNIPFDTIHTHAQSVIAAFLSGLGLAEQLKLTGALKTHIRYSCDAL